jgi:hypothetical protein
MSRNAGDRSTRGPVSKCRPVVSPLATEQEQEFRHVSADGLSKAQIRYVQHGGTRGSNYEATKWQVRSSGSWGLDWSAQHRNTTAQIALANYIDECLRPEATAVLYTPDRLDTTEFRRRVEAWRITSAKLHPVGFCPSRRFRKLEYILALEYGSNPKRAATGRLHGHVLLYNLRSIGLEDLALAWRELNDIRNPDEPLLQRYTPGPEGILYCLKTLGTDADLIHFSRKLSLRMAAESPL